MNHSTDVSSTSLLSYRLGEWVAGLRYEDLPKKVVREVRRYLLDSIGCAFGGWRTSDWRAVRDLAAQEGGARKCNLLGAGGKVAPLQAAMLNSLAIRALDYNDIY